MKTLIPNIVLSKAVYKFSRGFSRGLWSLTYIIWQHFIRKPILPTTLTLFLYIFSYAREQDMRGLSDALPKIPETNFSLNFQWYPPSVNAYTFEAKAFSSNLIYTLKAIKSVFMVCHLLCIHTIGAFFHYLTIHCKLLSLQLFLLYFSAFKSCYFSQPWF